MIKIETGSQFTKYITKEKYSPTSFDEKNTHFTALSILKSHILCHIIMTKESH